MHTQINEPMDNLIEFDRNWIKITGKLKVQFPILTDDDLFLDDDLILIEGKQIEMMCRLETKLGKTKQEIQELIISL